VISSRIRWPGCHLLDPYCAESAMSSW
jgi:hypothetical protein